MRNRPFSRYRSNIAALALVACALAGAPAHAQSAMQHLNVALVPSDTAAQVYYAVDLGLFSRAGILAEITPMNSGPAIAAGVASGALDIGFSNFVSLSSAPERGLPFTMVAPAT